MWEIMTCKRNRIISTMKEVYENYIAKSYPLILSMPEMDRYQKETFKP